MRGIFPRVVFFSQGVRSKNIIGDVHEGFEWFQLCAWHPISAWECSKPFRATFCDCSSDFFGATPFLPPWGSLRDPWLCQICHSMPDELRNYKMFSESHWKKSVLFLLVTWPLAALLARWKQNAASRACVEIEVRRGCQTLRLSHSKTCCLGETFCDNLWQGTLVLSLVWRPIFVSVEFVHQNRTALKFFSWQLFMPELSDVSEDV